MPADIGFSFNPTSIQINDPQTISCNVVAAAGLSNARADITILGPDSSVLTSATDVPLNEVMNGGFTQLEGSLSTMIFMFTTDNFGEYSCIAAVKSDSFPGQMTSIFRSIQVPTVGKLYTPAKKCFTAAYIIIVFFSVSGSICGGHGASQPATP